LNNWEEIAYQNGINIKLYTRRIKESGWDPKRAATTPVRGPRKDRKWLELALKNGIGRYTYITRVDRDFWSTEEAATTPVMTQEETLKRAREQNAQYTKIVHERIDKDPNNLFKITSQHIEIAKKNGIKKDTVRKRVFSYGWTVQDAITIPVDKKSKAEKSSEFLEFCELAIKNNIHPATFESRVKRGWTLEDAATNEILTSNKGSRWSKNKEWIEKAIKNGIKERTFKARVSHGWTPEDASSIPTLNHGEFLNDQTREKAREGFKKYRGITKKR
jgi:hypothetical protein